MPSGPLKHLAAVIATIILAVAPAAIRLTDSHPRWAMVRIGARPAEDDGSREVALKVKRLSDSADRVDPTLLILGIVSLLGLLVLIAPPVRGSGPWGACLLTSAASGLCAGWSSRAPPLA